MLASACSPGSRAQHWVPRKHQRPQRSAGAGKTSPLGLGLWALGFALLRAREPRTSRASRSAWKQKHLAMRLSELPRHPSHKPQLEQYATDGDTAACWLMGIDRQDTFAELEEGVLDLGAGNGILGIGALLLGAPTAIFVEVDPKTCEVLEEALEEQGLRRRAQIIQQDLAKCPQLDPELVVMNPPWGQQRRSADRPFLEASVSLSSVRAVHVMHSAEAKHVEPWAEDMGWTATRWLEIDFPLPRCYAHQRQRRSFTTAAMWRIHRAERAEQEERTRAIEGEQGWAEQRCRYGYVWLND
ncbi:unnamed protein product [Durusdinium trenchii]|uniref:Methyltransferase small domain-containing protein n=1 Tax=Durusdinium trenchii TaxID=1381693 RepID=A0ABP0HSL5_9DINO